MSDLPDWVQRNPATGLARLQHEGKVLMEQFPHIGIYRHGPSLYLEGPVLSMSKNMYLLRVVYPNDYPYSKPEVYVRDEDVVKFCMGKGSHDFHHYENDPIHGMRLCVMGATDNVNKGWTPKQSGVTLLEYGIMWIHGYEFKKVNGYWPLPENK